MSGLDDLLEMLVLRRGAPFAQVDVSGCAPGTTEEAMAAGGLTRSGLSAPFRSTGVIQADAYVGACLQEVWEGSWQQWALIVIGLPGALLAVLFGAALGDFSAPPFGAALTATGLLALALKLPDFQTGRSEIVSHEISREGAMRVQGITPERADQLFTANLKGYDYSGFSAMTDAQFEAEELARRDYAEAWLARPEVAALCAALKARVGQ